MRIEIRGLGLNLHRPTFAQPTWISVVLSELAITIDPNIADKLAGAEHSNGTISEPETSSDELELKKKPSRSASFKPQRSKSWEHLTSLKERIKKLHRNVNWIRMLDVVATNSTVTVVDVGQIQVGSFTMAVDTRRKMVDRARMFLHHKPKPDQRPAEWMFTLRSVLFTPEGRESLEVLDHASLDIHGLLFKDLDGLRDAAISLKLGRIHIPYDDISCCINKYKATQRAHTTMYEKPEFGEIGMADLFEELDRPGSRDEKLVQTVSDSKEFVGSVLRGIKEVQFAVSYIGFTKKVSSIRPHGQPLYVNASMKEVGVELHRLDPKSPAHRMYFSSKDIAHQALAAALSIAVSVDDGQGKPDRLMYIPMATTTVRTTLPSKTVEFVGDNSAAERNANIMFANIVITSPSIDLDPRHLPIVLALLNSRQKTVAKEPLPRRHHHLISRLLPKANVKFSMHEPVLRIALPPVEKTAEEDDFDLIISSISSISLDIESSHSAVGKLHYSLGSTMRVQSHDLYYQTSSGERYDLLQTESLELKVHVSANPEVYVVATCNLQTFSIHMVRPEISDGVRQIVRQLRLNVQPERTRRNSSKDPNFVRALPPWLVHFQFQGKDFSAEVAGVDEDISPETRGLALQLESWTAEYLAQRADSSSLERRSSRRRTNSRSLAPDPEMLGKMPQSPVRKQQSQHATDGRRLAVHVRGLEGFVVESCERWEPEPFIAMPRFEVALSTSSDSQGPIFHVNSVVKTLLLQYSLYRHYAFGIAATVLKKAFVRTKADVEEAEKAREIKTLGRDYLSPALSPDSKFGNFDVDALPAGREMVVVDFRSTLLQIKASMPADPPAMIQIYGLEAGRHRFSAPFLYAKLARLYAEAPRMKRVWARIVSIKSVRIDLRESRKKYGTGEMLDEKMIDVNAEAIRLAIPHQLVLYKVTDNFVNTVKAVEQLHHRFITGTNEYILDKRPEGPKKVPKMSIRSKALLFELEDGAFEWKLGNIYRTGLIEQKQRLAREEAFKVKAKRIEEEELRKDSSRFRNRSAHPRGRSAHQDSSQPRSKSADSRHRSQSHRGRKMRYDPEGTCGISGAAKISITEAREKLQRHNSQSWKKRIDTVFNQSTQSMKELRGVFWGPDELPEEMEEEENILQVPQRPGLMALLISDLRILLDKPSFPITELPEYLHRIGKGMPYDMKYTLLIPTHIQIDMGEARVTLRDYPLPLLHVPAIKIGQSPRLPAWSLKTDFVIAEEFRGPESTRHVKVAIVPPVDHSPGRAKRGFFIDVRRTVAPVKCYSDISIDINTSLPTRITWGASYQPAIQDMMMVLESFTKPQVDPSDRAGFWDKIRLSFHSRVGIAWKGDGDVHLMLKGTRDPYMITGSGAGLLMCWRNDVRWNICRDGDPRRFMTVDSGEYILAVPDYSHQARASDSADQNHDDDSVMSDGSFKRGVVFKKVAMKLSGNVQWVAGIMFERDTGIPGQRSFEFEPHYNVVLKEPRYAKSTPEQEYDAFKGFRSNYIHLSIAVKAPVDREWSVSNMKPSKSYNTVHLTPRFFTHFFDWWAMFGGTMSLPIRQGTLWPGLEKSSKKFGRHLATIKYSLLLAPLFVSHVYKHKDAEDYAEDVVSATGLKMRLDSFMLDVHQRREHFPTHDKGKKTQGKTSAMKMHEAQLDLLSADIRAVSASIAGTTTEDLQKASSPVLSSQQEPAALDLSHFEIPDNDFSWIDMDDFVELDWILPSEANPETKIMPLAYAPRFTYFRQTDHGDSISGDPDRTSAFGNEPTHFCTMSKDDDPRRVQCELIQRRLDQLQKQVRAHRKSIGDAELRIIQDENNTALKEDFNQMHQHGNHLQDKKIFLESMMHRMSTRVNTNNKNAVPDGDGDADSDEHSPSKDEDNPAPDFASDFNNRFVIHNMQMKWNNLLRNIILRYIHQVSQRRGFVYYLSRRAVKFILDIVEEQSKAKSAKASPYNANGTRSTSASTSPINDDTDAAREVEDRINEILSDGKNFVSVNDDLDSEEASPISTDNLNANISEDFAPQNSYHLRLIAPQIQLQSEKNPKDAALVTAKGMELKVIEVMDKDRIYDDVSGLVQRRFSVEMDSTQFFVTHEKWFSSQLLSLYSGSHYGAPAGSSWPPWVPMEVMFDFKVDPFGFQRVVQKTSASLRYDKYNTLRLKYGDDVNTDGSHRANPENVESRMDHLWVEFPQVRAICDSSQYYALYIIVLDLLMYSEPLEKTRSERLEKIMLASDFSDLRGAPEMVIRLQERIRQLDELKTQFQVNSKYLDQKGWEDRLALDRDLTSCEDELFFMMKAITSSQRKYEGTQTSGLLRWNISSEQIVWHLIRGNSEPLMEFQLQNAEYDRTDNSDGSHINSVQVGKIIGLNLLPDAIYPEMIGPYSNVERGTFSEGGNQHMLRVYWYMLEAIAGIPVMDHFEVNLFPMKIQLEREVGKKLFEYIFPDSRDDKHDKHDKHEKHGGIKNKSPLMIQQTIPSDVADEANGSETTFLVKDKETSGRAGSLELRLKPTLNSEQRPNTATEQRPKPVNFHSSFGPPENHHRFKLFHSSTDRTSTSSRTNSSKALSKKASSDSLQSGLLSRPSIGRSGTHFSNPESGSTASGSKRFAIGRKESKKKEKPSDDLTKMMDRASNYMTLAYVKIPSVVLCLSYKGKGERNIEDVHDFVFRLPMIEYRNKTWSNLDLALALKKDVIRALISHTGAIIGNKFSKHRPNATQQHRLRELATSSTLLTPTQYDSSNDNSDASTFASSPIESRQSEPRRSFASSLNRPSTASNSITSLQSNGRSPTLSSNMAMTPMHTEDSGSFADSDMSSNRPGKDDEKHGFMSNTLNRLKRSNTQRPSTFNPDDDSKDDSGDAGSTRRKSKLLLGKKILSRSDH